MACPAAGGYWRLHGSLNDDERMAALAEPVQGAVSPRRGAPFDNTASGAVTEDALRLQALQPEFAKRLGRDNARHS